jgi:hypothetical protein
VSFGLLLRAKGKEPTNAGLNMAGVEGGSRMRINKGDYRALEAEVDVI